MSSSAGGDARAAQLIDSIRKQLTATMEPGSDTDAVSISLGDSIEVNELIGQGSFGQVFKGKWRDHTVAVKSMILPVKMAGTEKKERMALMEAAISSSLVHRNIVKTHTYSIKPIRDNTSASQLAIPSQGNSPQIVKGSGSSFGSIQRINYASLNGPVSAFEVKIVLEFCDLGSLADALRAGRFHTGSTPNYPVILELASDIAEGCRHLHSCNIIHADLKASNVLLQSSSDFAKGCVAKVSDFGLSISKMDSAETHVSGLYQGTLTHMSPETLMTGQQSNAGDVYSFAITLYELYTATSAFRNIPLTFIGHRVAKDHLRPVFPPHTPSGFKELAEACWHPTPAQRPSFDAIVSTLNRLKAAAPYNSASQPTFAPSQHSLGTSGIMPSQISVDAHQLSREECLVSYQAEGLQRIQDQESSLDPTGGAFILTNIDSVASPCDEN